MDARQQKSNEEESGGFGGLSGDEYQGADWQQDEKEAKNEKQEKCAVHDGNNKVFDWESYMNRDGDYDEVVPNGLQDIGVKYKYG